MSTDVELVIGGHWPGTLLRGKLDPVDQGAGHGAFDVVVFRHAGFQTAIAYCTITLTYYQKRSKRYLLHTTLNPMEELLEIKNGCMSIDMACKARNDESITGAINNA